MGIKEDEKPNTVGFDQEVKQRESQASGKFGQRVGFKHFIGSRSLLSREHNQVALKEPVARLAPWGKSKSPAKTLETERVSEKDEIRDQDELICPEEESELDRTVMSRYRTMRSTTPERLEFFRQQKQENEDPGGKNLYLNEKERMKSK